MNVISFSENNEFDLIAYENGQPLAATQDPRSEALKWVYSLGHLPTQSIVIIGLGSGFHVAALAELDPTLEITVIETRASLIPIFRSKFADISDRVQITIVDQPSEIFKTDAYADVLARKSFVLSFRECWGARTETFTELFAHMVGRSVDSVQYHLQEMGMNMKSLFFNRSALLSIKDILPAVEASSVNEEYKQRFRVLGELVR